MEVSDLGVDVRLDRDTVGTFRLQRLGCGESPAPMFSLEVQPLGFIIPQPSTMQLRPSSGA